MHSFTALFLLETTLSALISFRSIRRLPVLVVFTVLLLYAGEARAQVLAKYGGDFLAGGVGARALGMGGTAVGLVQDVTAGYWNVAGLSGLDVPEVAYMHAERFSGVVSFDYGGAAFPISSRSTVGLSVFRVGVDDIPNTLNAWDRERNQPLPNAENYVTRFSAADYAFFLSYARMASEQLSFGVTGKIIRRGIGDFAEAWGYSFDVGAQYRTRSVVLGVQLQDASTMLQSWSINEDAFAIEGINPDTGEPFTFQETFGQALPEGGSYLVLPVMRLGSGLVVPMGESALTLGLDMDVAFDGQRAYAFNAGDISFHPRFGTEFSYKGVLALRAGLDQISTSEVDGFNATPSVGAGLNFKQLSVDYGFGDFSGLVSELGYSHRISVQFRLSGENWQRAQPSQEEAQP